MYASVGVSGVMAFAKFRGVLRKNYVFDFEFGELEKVYRIFLAPLERNSDYTYA